MKNQINISNLTPEQIEEVRQQLKAFDEQPKTIMDRVKSWEDAKNIVKPEFWIGLFGEIEHDVQNEITKNHIPSEKHAKSILATSQLMVIAEALRERCTYTPVTVCYDNVSKKFKTIDTACIDNLSPISFPDVPTAKHTITQFPELWYDYFMIDKPDKK